MLLAPSPKLRAAMERVMTTWMTMFLPAIAKRTRAVAVCPMPNFHQSSTVSSPIIALTESPT